jgi:large subunit ribosomal protein L19|tara:strand:- start:112 stop:465 length:354 start_codon:yes stop_codon:yes gene_type:complete
MQELTRIHGAAKLNPRIEPFRAGDAIEIKHVHNVGDAKQQTFKGVVLAVRNKGLGSNFIVRNVLDGEAVEYMFPKFSPLIHSIKVLQKAFIHKGRKRVRRAKLYYLRDRPPAETTVR